MSEKAIEKPSEPTEQEKAEMQRRMDTMHKLVDENRVEEAMLREYLFPNAPLVIDILIPSRNRPDNIMAFMDAVYETTEDRANVGMMFYIDQDDRNTIARLDEMTKWADERKDMRIRFHVGVRMGLAHVYEFMRQRIPGDVIMYTGDDIRFMTKGWDSMVRKAFIESGDRVMLLWGKDSSRDQPFPDNGFVSRWGINCLKYLFPVFPPLNPDPAHPELGGQGISFTDIWLEACYNTIGRKRYMPEMVFEHHHWRHTGVSGTALATSQELKERPELDAPYVATNIVSKTWVTPEFEQRQSEVPEHARNLVAWMDFYAKWCIKNTKGYEETVWYKHYLARQAQDKQRAKQIEQMKEMEAAVKAGMARDALGRVIVPDLREAPWEKAKDEVSNESDSSGAAMDQQLATAIEEQSDAPPVEAVEKKVPGRNAPCPCGSGKKWKKCCGSEVAA